MIFMQSIAHELRKCWSIEEMAGLVCSRIMSETPYDRGMVYRFDPSDHSGEVVYETTRWDARKCCREDSFLGLRFPASDIPRQARELFMRNTLRFVYDVEGVDYALYPAKIVRGKMMGVVHGGEARYTDLSMCRLRGSSYIHLEYLRNMKVTSTLVIAIIVNKRLWGLYSFHGYRHPIRPSARTRFLCEMASVMTSMVMESLTRTNDQSRLMNIDDTLSNLKDLSLIDYMNDPLHSQRLFDLLDVNLISFRSMDDRGNVHIYNYHSEENNIHQSNNNNDATTTTSPTTPLEVTPEAFQCLSDTYGQVCHDYGVVFVNETKAHPALGSLHTIAFFQFPPSHPNPNNNNNNNVLPVPPPPRNPHRNLRSQHQRTLRGPSPAAPCKLRGHPHRRGVGRFTDIGGFDCYQLLWLLRGRRHHWSWWSRRRSIAIEYGTQRMFGRICFGILLRGGAGDLCVDYGVVV
mmetsp:Transcript_42373/g.88932  ORF Transcript_42373/g.88932 Transcript_42373/m.88932 type:complete len:461 (+) Transcript_42373:1825-3207(+)